MKKFLWGLLIVIVLAVIGFGIWGYLKASDIKKQGREINEITGNTLNLQTVSMDSADIQLEPWKNLSDKSTDILNQLAQYSAPSDIFKEKARQFYSAKAKDKYGEIQYLQFLKEFQSSMDLKINQPKSKGQIETILTSYDTSMAQSVNLAVGPEFNSSLEKVRQEAAAYKSNLADLSSRMNYSSPAVQLNSAGLDKAIDQLKQEITLSLNGWVDLQNVIKDEIANMGNANWVMPF